MEKIGTKIACVQQRSLFRETTCGIRHRSWLTMSTGTTLRRAQLEKSYDTIVIGSGIGGLTAAACLAQAGQAVLVLERHDTPGGFTHTFERKGYAWAVGVHYIGEVHRPGSLLRKVFDHITDQTLAWHKTDDVYDQIILGEEVFDFVSGPEAFETKMGGYFPREERAIARYLALVDDVGQAATPFFSLQALPPRLAHLLRPVLARPFLRYASRTTDAVLSELTQDPKLKAVLTGQWGNYGLPPQESSFAMHALVAKHYMHGASYPVGGPGAIAASMEPVIRRAGGLLVTRAPVKEILVAGRKARGVTLEDGQTILSQRVVSAVGVRNTYATLLPEALRQRSALSARLAPLAPSTAHLCLYLGLQGTTHELGLKNANLWVMNDTEPRCAPLAGLEALLKVKVPVVFVSFPSTKDPLWAGQYPGKSTVEVVVPIPFDPMLPWEGSAWRRRGADYERLKAAIMAQLVAFLEGRLPQIKGRIVHAELSTPLSTAHFCNYTHGEIYGLRHDPRRFQQPWLQTDPGFGHLYLTGQDVVTCGIGGACLAGALTALRILGPLQGRELVKIFLSLQ